ncbi:unnamed protein product [Colias eurytheme]|nr:unnamed protein product [Colias eurytheme]
MRKWLSNSQAVLAGLPEDHQQDPYIFQNTDNPDAIAVLGVQYQPFSDVFTFRVQDLDVVKTWTKRTVLSTVARIYDPNERVTNTSKTAVSLMFAATAEGQILPVYVVYKAEHLWDTWTEGGLTEELRYKNNICEIANTAKNVPE